MEMPEDKVFTQLLNSTILTEQQYNRCLLYTKEERIERLNYHQARYLESLSNDELFLRVGYFLANATAISTENCYSTNNIYGFYWVKKLAHTLEELAIRNIKTPLSVEILHHLPNLGFPIPNTPILNHTTTNALFRYAKFKRIKSLYETGEIKIRTASTKDVQTDFARNDDNELCTQVTAFSKDINITMHVQKEQKALLNLQKYTQIEMHQHIDYFMFCLSEVFDYRLFGDFNSNSSYDDIDEKPACLVITDPKEFGRRMHKAIQPLTEKYGYTNGWKFKGRSAFYYDPYDIEEYAPLFENANLLPFAKKREFTYQHEFRFISQPILLDHEFPLKAEDVPLLNSDLIRLGSLKDISYIIQTEKKNPSSYYLSQKDSMIISSALGVTLPEIDNSLLFIYSVTKRVLGKKNTQNLVAPYKIKQCLQHHDIQIVTPINVNDLKDGKLLGTSLLQKIIEFYKIFNIKEHQNFLISYEVKDRNKNNKKLCEYRAYLPATESFELENRVLEFEYIYNIQKKNKIYAGEKVTFLIDGQCYKGGHSSASQSFIPSYKSLIFAEKKFIDFILADLTIEQLLAYECYHLESNYRCSTFMQVI